MIVFTFGALLLRELDYWFCNKKLQSITMTLSLKIILSLATLAFLYFGYKDDFARNKKEATYIVSVVLIMMISFLSMFKTNVYVAILVSFAIGSLGLLFKSNILKKFGK